MTCLSSPCHGWYVDSGRIEVCDCGTYDPPKWVEKGDAPCLLPHFRDPERPRRAYAGWLCSGHFSRLEQMIAELPSLYDELGLALTSSEKPNNEGGHAKNSQVKGGVSLNGKVTDARDEIRAECWRMAHDISETRGIDLPLQDTVNAVSAWLLAQLDWIVSQADAPEFYGYLDILTRSSRALAYPSSRQRIDVTKNTGRSCSKLTTCDVITHSDKPCGGNLEARLTGSGWEGDEGRLTCDRCGLERPITLVALADFEEVA